MLAKDLERKAVEGLLLWEGEQCAAILLYYYAYSTWEGQYIHMEDLYVSQSHRRKGYGTKMWISLGKRAKERNCRRLQWNVLDWNQNAIEFYKKASLLFLDERCILDALHGSDIVRRLAPVPVELGRHHEAG